MHFGTNTLILCFLIEFPIHMDTIVYFKGSEVECIYDDYFGL